MDAKCPICGRIPNTKVTEKGRAHIFEVNCEVCGKYEITRTAMAMEIGNKHPTYLLSAGLRANSEDNSLVSITNSNISDIVASATPPEEPLEAIDKILFYIYTNSKKASDSILFDHTKDYPIAYAKDHEEFLYYLRLIKELDFVEASGNQFNYRLSIKGWERISKLRKKQAKSKNAFVAMWFREDMNSIWEDGFKSALIDVGYNPIRVDYLEHNEKICDRIISEIRSSGLLIADFTGNRGGVYFEAGFAMGLGIPVIWTCCESDIKDVHFDTRQYNHIVWTDSKDIRQKLANRIKATIPSIEINAL